MSDTALRDLERRWRATRDPADEARLLAERLRARALSRARLEVAGYAGHGPAIEAMGAAAPVGQHVPWARWRAALDEAGRAALARLALVRLEALASADAVTKMSLAPALDAVRAWCACPCELHSVEVAARLVDAERLPSLGATPEEVVFPMMLRSLQQAITTPLQRGRGERRRRDPVQHLVWSLSTERQLDAPDLLAALDGVVRWALGDEHPLVVAAAPAERAYLAERLRRGELPQERLEVAAYAGSDHARDLLGGAAGDPPEDTAEWIVGLDRWGRSWPVRALAHAAGGGVRSSGWPASPPSREEFQLLTDELFLRRTTCSALTAWANDAADDPVHLTPRLERLAADARLETYPERARLVRLLRDVVACVRTRSLPGLDLVRDVLAERSSPRDIRDVVRGWALRYDAGCRPRDAPRTAAPDRGS